MFAFRPASSIGVVPRIGKLETGGSRTVTMHVQATRSKAAGYGTPYQVMEAYAAGRLSEAELVDILAGWRYVAVPDRHDAAGISSEPSECVGGSVADVIMGYDDGLIGAEVYDRVLDRLRERRSA